MKRLLGPARRFSSTFREANHSKWEVKLRKSGWETYRQTANNKEFLRDFATQAELLKSDNTLQFSTKLGFSLMSLLAVGFCTGFVATKVWNNNKSIILGYFKIKEDLTNTEDLIQDKLINDNGQISHMRAYVLPSSGGSQKIQIVIFQENNGVREVSKATVISAVQVDTNTPLYKLGPCLEYKNQQELIERLAQSQVNSQLKLEIPLVPSEPFGPVQTFNVYFNGNEMSNITGWKYRVLFPVACLSATSAVVTWLVSSWTWQRYSKKNFSHWALKAITRPWRQGFILGSKIAVGSLLISSALSFCSLYVSHAVRIFRSVPFEERGILIETWPLENGQQTFLAHLKSVPLHMSVFVMGSVVCGSAFVIPLGAIVGRFVCGKIYHLLSVSRPRSTLALRTYARNPVKRLTLPDKPSQ
jgi:hypothetical protein